MKTKLLSFFTMLVLCAACETTEPEYFINENLVVLKVSDRIEQGVQPTPSKFLLLSRVKQPVMVAELSENHLRTLATKLSYRVGDTIHVKMISKSNFWNQKL